MSQPGDDRPSGHARSPGGGESDPWWHAEPQDDHDGSGSSTAVLLAVAVDEILKLAESVQEWGRSAGVGSAARDAIGQVSAALDGASEPDPAWCQVCPMCRLAAAVGAVRPDLAEGLSQALAVMTEVARAALDAVAGNVPPGSSKLD